MKSLFDLALEKYVDNVVHCPEKIAPLYQLPISKKILNLIYSKSIEKFNSYEIFYFENPSIFFNKHLDDFLEEISVDIIDHKIKRKGKYIIFKQKRVILTLKNNYKIEMKTDDVITVLLCEKYNNLSVEIQNQFEKYDSFKYNELVKVL